MDLRSDSKTVWSTKCTTLVGDAAYNNIMKMSIQNKEFRLIDPEIDVDASLAK